MADPTSNNIQPTNDMNPMSSLNHGNQDELTKALNNLINVLEGRSTSGNAIRRAPTYSQSNFADRQAKWKFDNSKNKASYKRTGNILDDFEQGIKDQLLDSLAGGNFKKGMQGALSTFTKEFGIELKDLPHELGKNVGKQLLNTNMGKSLSKQITSKGVNLFNSLFKDSPNAKAALLNVGASFKASAQSGVVSGAEGAAIASGASSATQAAALAELTEVLLNPAVLAGVAAIAAGVVTLGPAIQGLGKVVGAVGKSMMKDEDARRKRLEQSQKRLESDMEVMVKRPFEILKQAAESWANTWDSNLKTIAGTQGYDKNTVYSLYSSYAERLTSEGLSAVISATDVVDKLSSVLETGLSGKVAEEFAYTATKLSAAIPTEDFFSYASAYSSLASSMIANGYSQEEAIAYANSQLESFASNLLYSSRELAGGFSSGLKNASDLFNQSVEIARTARVTDIAGISGTLTSVSAIIGAVAPDLASGLVSNVVSAAIGGNDSSIVALRSLAGINAGNTEFLRQMAEDPQAIFTQIFTNLASMQTMSPSNYMEVAEGLASVFGVDMKAFAQVDFSYLAQAIASMNINNQSLEENMELLASGSTATLAEQQKMEEINKMILDEGLAYVMDNEVARSIQEHMWQEQIANELQEASYAVEIQGAALEFLEGIRETVTNVLNFLNPLAFIGRSLSNLTEAVAEAASNDQDLREILELGAVGSNATALYNLTTRGEDLGLTRSLVEIMGGTRGSWNVFGAISNRLNRFNDVVGGTLSASAFNQVWSDRNSIFNAIVNGATGFATPSSSSSIQSRYTWNTIGKSAIAALTGAPNITELGAISGTNSMAAYNAQQAKSASNARFQEFLNTVQDAASTMTYEEWKSTARDYGIANFDEALQNYGRTENEVSNLFQTALAKAGAEEQERRAQDEITFREQIRGFWDLESGTNGIFQSSMWTPFYGDGMKYDTRMDSVDMALTRISTQIGKEDTYTVIGGLEELNNRIGADSSFTVISVLRDINTNIENTFVQTSSAFQKYLEGWATYRANVTSYSSGVSKSAEWTALQNASEEEKNNTTLALAKALQEFTASDLQKMDPQLQANAMIGQIIVILQAMLQQNNNAGSINFIDTLSALGLGTTIQS